MKHKTKDGDSMFISEMSEQHLNHTISMHLRNIEENYQLLTWDKKVTINSLLYERDIDFDEVKRRVKQIDTILPFYIMEASIRWIDFSEQLQKVYWRTDKLVTNNLLLDSWDEDEEDEYEDEDELKYRWWYSFD